MAENPKISKTSGKYFFTGPGCWTIALGTSIFSPPKIIGAEYLWLKII